MEKIDELNRIIAEQQGVALEDIAIKPEFKEATTQAPPADAYVQEPVAQTTAAQKDGVLSDEDLAASYRSQADRLFKEAKALREQAEELVTTKKKKTTTSA